MRQALFEVIKTRSTEWFIKIMISVLNAVFENINLEIPFLFKCILEQFLTWNLWLLTNTVCLKLKVLQNNISLRGWESSKVYVTLQLNFCESNKNRKICTNSNDIPFSLPELGNEFKDIFPFYPLFIFFLVFYLSFLFLSWENILSKTSPVWK